MSEKLRGLAAKGLTQSEAARKLGVSRQRVSQVAARLGLAFRRGAPPIPEERLKELARKGLTKTEAARELGVPLDHVRSQGEKLQLSFAPAWSRPKAPTTEFGRILQAARLASGYSYSRLAELSGLNTEHVRTIERGWIRQPRAKTIRALADCLGGHTTYDELIRAAWAGHPPVSEQRLKELAKKGITQTEAARELGVSQGHVRKLAIKLGVSFAPAWSRPKAPITEFGRILQAARLASGYSYSRLAVLSGLNRHHLTDLDLGRVRQPKEKTLRALADCLGGPALYEELARAVHEAAAPMQRGARN
ncbi:MAG: helix-turn-helix domain-containing protein [Chloroflexi bacterium]|nr:helix-turn-helix domain-containing protein [Chloroflexota bacterium]